MTSEGGKNLCGAEWRSEVLYDGHDIFSKVLRYTRLNVLDQILASVIKVRVPYDGHLRSQSEPKTELKFRIHDLHLSR